LVAGTFVIIKLEQKEEKSDLDFCVAKIVRNNKHTFRALYYESPTGSPYGPWQPWAVSGEQVMQTFHKHTIMVEGVNLGDDGRISKDLLSKVYTDNWKYGVFTPSDEVCVTKVVNKKEKRKR